jgi:hypothetical protein
MGMLAYIAAAMREQVLEGKECLIGSEKLKEY